VSFTRNRKAGGFGLSRDDELYGMGLLKGEREELPLSSVTKMRIFVGVQHGG
jgi:hypothetical protein